MVTRVGPKKDPTLCLNACRYLREYCETCNIHGVHYLTERRPKAEKIFWFLTLLLSISGCSFMIHEIWIKYQKNPIVVSFANEVKSLYEIPFPAVTVCPESKCSQSKFNYSRVYGKLLNNESLSHFESHAFFYLRMVCKNLGNEFPNLLVNKTVGDDFFLLIEEVKYKMRNKKIMTKCSRQLKPNIELSCSFLEHFTCDESSYTPIITDVGICYSMNMLEKSEIFRPNVIYDEKLNFTKSNYSSGFDGETGFTESAGVHSYPYRAFKSGVDNSLDLVLVDQVDYDEKCSAVQGYRLLIHRPQDIPRMSKNYIRVSHDKETTVAIEPALILTSPEVKNINPKKRRCYLKGEKVLKYFLVYSQSNCQLECYTNFTMKTCGCVFYFMPREGETPVCGAGSYNCLELVKVQFKLEEVKIKRSDPSEYACGCRPSCNNLHYNVEVSQTDVSYQTFSENVDRNASEKRRYAQVKIYFKHDEFMSLERKELYGVSDLISNFGGLLGLFTGFSLISAVELIYFLTLRPYCNCKVFGRWWGSPK
ncbi:pickpocket protein 28-like isoform X1 [Tribolium castaneum]|uniref:pickpocket protein 28-like isoform X1 n=1 Tax=Tribolium castaneum TaxID=7070 RepID=UPI00077DBF19|nr:PREDICTED: pickpocket protein 28-like isoform X1 [Tribolium castaneum]XP_015833970.1 PREDICTED: pickpocket protein 28-like isoform X1 [Tribolium castaneum]|eukprot:XP_015833969.1 PREDICTED: pickpocket protein 28-like isoform X1 [Tribolium castaneum]